MELHDLLAEIDSVNFDTESFNSFSIRKLDFDVCEAEKSGFDLSEIDMMSSEDHFSKEELLSTDKRNRSPLYSAIISNDVERVKKLLSSFVMEQLELLNVLFSRSVKRCDDWVQPRAWMQPIKESEPIYRELSKAYHTAELMNPINRGMRFLPLERRLAAKIHGQNDLMIMVIEGNEKSVLEILSEDPHLAFEADRQGWNALMHAIFHGKISIANHLMKFEHRKQLQQSDRTSGLNAFTLAIIKRQFSVVRDILALMQNNEFALKELLLSQDCLGRTPLTIACEILNNFPNEQSTKFAPTPYYRKIETELLEEAHKECAALFSLIKQAFRNLGLIKVSEVSMPIAAEPRDTAPIAAVPFTTASVAALILPALQPLPDLPPIFDRPAIPAIVVNTDKSRDADKRPSRVVLSPITSGINQEEHETRGVFLSKASQAASKAERTSTRRKEYEGQTTEVEGRNTKRRMTNMVVAEKQSKPLFRGKSR